MGMSPSCGDIQCTLICAASRSNSNEQRRIEIWIYSQRSTRLIFTVIHSRSSNHLQLWCTQANPTYGTSRGRAKLVGYREHLVNGLNSPVVYVEQPCKCCAANSPQLGREHAGFKGNPGRRSKQVVNMTFKLSVPKVWVWVQFAENFNAH